ncbi:unnamed protein product [Parnassius mnemosyne]|uniref:MADF domain-containing protein n=1 Tax=Parnassius mnemosyne TaxID=213953 RepID=A0AAV1M4C1_9NEOP
MASRKRNATLEEFIEIYKSESCLRRVKCKEYHDRDKRSTAYEKLITKLKESEPTATKDDVIKKITTLRSNVRREKKYDESVKSGASSDDIFFYFFFINQHYGTLNYSILLEIKMFLAARDLTFRTLTRMIRIEIN